MNNRNIVLSYFRSKWWQDQNACNIAELMLQFFHRDFTRIWQSPRGSITYDYTSYMEMCREMRKQLTKIYFDIKYCISESNIVALSYSASVTKQNSEKIKLRSYFTTFAEIQEHKIFRIYDLSCSSSHN